jgi:hypothetical protein
MFAILDLNPIISEIKWSDPVIAGGFATALFAAPRIGRKPGLISRKYYSDIDIYPNDDKHRMELKAQIESAFENEIIKFHETERAWSFTIKIPQVKDKKKYSIYTAQIMRMKELENGIDNIFASYDLVSSVVAVRPYSQEIYYHRDFMRHHLARELELYQPQMFFPTSSEDEIIVQLLRIHKYCMRWEYTLSENTLSKLLDVYHAQPDICLDPSKVYKMNSGQSKPLITHSTANVWKLMATIIRESKYWKDDMDKLGVITNKKKKEPMMDMNLIFTQMEHVVKA